MVHDTPHALRFPGTALALRRRIGYKFPGERQGQSAVFPDYAASDQILAGVVMDGDDFCRNIRRAFEFNITRWSILAAAMASANFFLWRTRRSSRVLVGSS